MTTAGTNDRKRKSMTSIRVSGRGWGGGGHTWATSCCREILRLATDNLRGSERSTFFTLTAGPHAIHPLPKTYRKPNFSRLPVWFAPARDKKMEVDRDNIRIPSPESSCVWSAVSARRPPPASKSPSVNNAHCSRTGCTHRPRAEPHPFHHSKDAKKRTIVCIHKLLCCCCVACRNLRYTLEKNNKI